MSRTSLSDPKSPEEGTAPPFYGDCVLHLVKALQRVLHVEDPEASTLSDLATGATLYRLLHEIDPTVFMDVTNIIDVEPSVITASEDPKNSSATASVKSNLLVLIRHMNEYSRNNLDGRRSGFNLAAMVNAETLVGVATTREPIDEDQSAQQQFMALIDNFVSIVALCGVPAVLNTLKELPREEQKVLSNATRESMQKNGLKPFNQSSRASAMAGDPERRSALRATRFGSPLISGGVTAASTSSTSNAATGNRHSNSNGAEGPREFSHYAENVRLTEELKVEKVRNQELESRCALAERGYQTLQAQYDETVKDLASRSTESVTLQQKTELVETLTKKLEEQQARVASLKKAVSVQELGMAAFQKKFSQQEETLKLKESANEDLKSRLLFKETELTHHVEAKETLMRELEEVRGKLCVAQLAAKDASDGPADSPAEDVLNASFTSTGSVGRALALERDISEIRQQRDNLQKQLYVLRRQYATARTKEETVAEQDTLRAQVRQLERERDTLQQQLDDALERVEELEGQGGGMVEEEGDEPVAEEEPEEPLHHREGGRRVVTPTIPYRTPRAMQGGAASGYPPHAVDGVPSYLQPKAVHSVLYSTLVSYGYRNLMLQQHDLLLYGSGSEASATRWGEKTDMAKAVVSGSLLHQQRQMIERGLLESILHHRDTKK